MTINQYEQGDPTNETRIDRWDAAPRDGPAVFVVDTATFDADGLSSGRWVDPTAEPEDVRSAIGNELAETGRWAIVDQVGLGNTMVPEQLSIKALVRVARERAGDRQ